MSRLGTAAVAGALVAALAVLPASPEPAFLDGPGAAWDPPSVTAMGHAFDAAFAADPLRTAHGGLVVLDPRTGATLYAHDAEQPVTPASTLKLVVGLASLAALGPRFTFTTTLETAGTLGADGTLTGDVRLRGGGDPLLPASVLPDAAAGLAASGVRRIAGCVTTDASAFDDAHYGAGWMLEDLGSPFSAPVSGLDLDENVVPLSVAPGAAPGAPALVSTSPDVTVERNRIITGTAGSEDSTDVESRDRDGVDLVGSVPLGRSVTLRVAVDDPGRHARRLLDAALASAGIAFGADAPCLGGAPLATPWRYRSQPLATVLREFWVRSDNLVGESLLKTLGTAGGGVPGTWTGGLRAEGAFLRSQGAGAGGYAIVDGSGLSRYDGVPPRLLATLLRAAWNGPERDTVLAALPSAGIRGELPGALATEPALQRRLAAKTGSMTHVRGLAGYLATRRHGTVVFAWLVDDLTGDPERLAALEARALRAVTEMP